MSWEEKVKIKFERYVIKILSRSDIVDEEMKDCVQKCWADVFRYIEEQELHELPDEKMKALIGRIANNKCVDWIRSQVSTRKGLDKYRQNVTKISHHKGRDPERMTIIRDCLEKINTEILMKKFSQKDNEILQLNFEGYTAPQIADFLGCSKSDVNNTVQKLRKILRCREDLKGYVP